MLNTSDQQEALRRAQPFTAEQHDVDQNQIRRRCEDDHVFFTRYFFKLRNGIKFRVNWHHYVIARALQRVIDGTTKNLVINVPPGSSKTEMAIINFIARCIAINPNCRFLHISSGEDLVLLNSQTARDIVQSDEFQELWPMMIADDAKAKKRWNVMRESESGKILKGGGVYAVALGGQITGFRAGHMTEGFQGAILIDDPLKADNAFSEAAVKAANRQLLTTVKSRKANPDTPIILIMQRVGEKDPTGFIKAGNLPGVWEYVIIPALIDDAYVATLDEDLREMVDSSHRCPNGRFSYWPYKEPLEDLLALESGSGTDKEGNRVSRFVFNSQYQQSPKAIGGNIIHGRDFKMAGIAPKIIYRKIFGDTAMKTGEANDYSVFQCWGKGEDGKSYLLDMIRGKWEAPDLKRMCRAFWAKHRDTQAYPTAQWGLCREMAIEDKASGTGLIQDIKRGETIDGVRFDPIPVKAIERSKDKLTRVMDVVSYIEAGLVCLLEGAPYVVDFISECEAFTADDSHAYDDQIDPMCDALVDMQGPRPRGFFDVM